MKISTLLQDIYKIEWNNLNILECGAHSHGEETSDLEKSNNCWYVEANESDFNVLKNVRKNTLNFALSDKNGKIKFNVSSHAGNSSCEHSIDHLEELAQYGAIFKKIEVDCIIYEKLLEKLNLTFDVLVLDIEGHEKSVLKTFESMNSEKLPKIIVIECGYDWNDRLKILKKIGYKIDCYYFNNCYLSKIDLKVDKERTYIYNNQWKSFTWNNKIIYKNELVIE